LLFAVLMWWLGRILDIDYCLQIVYLLHCYQKSFAGPVVIIVIGNGKRYKIITLPVMGYRNRYILCIGSCIGINEMLLNAALG